MTISLRDAELLRHAGFLEQEIEQIASAVTAKGEPQPPIDITSPIWTAVMESRREWWLDKIGRGWTESEITNELQNYYRRDKSRNPFDFIRAEYRPPTKRKDYLELIRKRAAAQIAGELEGYKV